MGIVGTEGHEKWIWTLWFMVLFILFWEKVMSSNYYHKLTNLQQKIFYFWEIKNVWSETNPNLFQTAVISERKLIFCQFESVFRKVVFVLFELLLFDIARVVLTLISVKCGMCCCCLCMCVYKKSQKYLRCQSMGGESTAAK